MTTATAPAVEKRKKPWTKARVIDLIIDIFCFVIVGAASLTCILPFIHILACLPCLVFSVLSHVEAVHIHHLFFSKFRL